MELLGEWFLRRVLAIACATLFVAPPASSQGVEQFYRGKSVDLLLGYAPGGFNDTLARIVARYLPNSLPGRPTIVVKNVPSAGGIGLANNLYNVVPKDGSVFASFDRTVAQLAIRGEPAVRFDPTKFTWLGSVASFENDAYGLFVSSNNAAKSAADLRGGNIKARLGTAGSGSTNVVFSLLSRDALGLNIDVIKGYSGTGPIFLAVRRGEVDGIVTGLSTVTSTHGDLWRDGKLRALVQYGRSTRHPDLPDVPTGRELAINADALALIEFAELPFTMARPFVAPPGLPPDRAQALKSAFMAMTKDPQFVGELNKVAFDDLSPIDGDAIDRLLQRSAATPKKVIDEYNEIVGSKH
jgi:tripartite-type tricarboxylate transporter receptor subunit TctC